MRRESIRRWKVLIGSVTWVARADAQQHIILAKEKRSQVIKTETIRLPFCLLRYQLEGSKSEQGISILVDGYRRAARLMKEQELPLIHQPDGVEEFPYPLDMGETVKIARSYLSSLRMARTFSPGVTFDRKTKNNHVIQYQF